MPPTLHQHAVKTQQVKGLASFSDYIQELIRKDIQEASKREMAA